MAYWRKLRDTTANQIINKKPIIQYLITLGDPVVRGLEADMPQPTGSKTFYYAYDTDKLYFDDGVGN